MDAEPILPVPGFKISALSNGLPLHHHSTTTSTKAHLPPDTKLCLLPPPPAPQKGKKNTMQGKEKEKTTVPFLPSLLKDPGLFKASLKEALLLIPSAMVGETAQAHKISEEICQLHAGHLCVCACV